MVILLVLAGAAYQAISSRLDARRFPESGRLVDVGGGSNGGRRQRTMVVVAKGSTATLADNASLRL